jgi:hypothetical protein
MLVAMALVFSMIPALAVSLASSASAAEPVPKAYGSDFILDEAGNGMARWVWDNIVEPGGDNDYHSSNHAAYLKAMNGGDSAGVIVTWGCTIGEIDHLSYWYRTLDINSGPAMGLTIDSNHDGGPNYFAVVNPCPPTKSSWYQWNEDFDTKHWDIYNTQLSPVQTSYNWDQMESYVGGDSKVLAVGVGYDWQRNITTCQGEALVDDIQVCDQSWDLEPIDKLCTKSTMMPMLPALSGNPIQIEVDDVDADTQGWNYDEMSTTNPDGNTTWFNVDKAPKEYPPYNLDDVVTEAYDLNGDLTVLEVAQTETGGKINIDSMPPDEFMLLDCTNAVENISLDNQPAAPTQLTVRTLNDDSLCDLTAPGANEYLLVNITGTSGTGGTGTPINELLFFVSDNEQTTTQVFGTVNAMGVDCSYSPTSAAKAIEIAAKNHVWFTYHWHQHDTVSVCAQAVDVTGAPTGEVVAVELVEVDANNDYAPTKDGGYFKGILYPVETSTNIDGPEGPLQRHDLMVEHCNTIELKYPDQALFESEGCDAAQGVNPFDTFEVDNEAPMISNESPAAATNNNLPTISVDIDDEKCMVNADEIRFFFDDIERFDFNWDGLTLTWTPPSTLPDGNYCVGLKFTDGCWNWAQDGWCFEVESTPPLMIDAVTGWTWAWGKKKEPVNTHTRTSVMVIWSEPLDPMTVQASDLTVNGEHPIDVEYHDYNWDCNSRHQYGLMFLTLATPLPTDAGAPDGPVVTVVQVGEVEDLAGNPCTKPYDWECPEDCDLNLGCADANCDCLTLELPQTVLAQDGIGPIISLTASPEEPGYNETVTVTATSSEPLSEAYLFIPTEQGMDQNGRPANWDWNHIKPIGWPPYWKEDPRPWGEGHGTGGWLAMTADPQIPSNRVWTATFTNPFGPDDDWFVEVAAHDFTEWWQDMECDGEWKDYNCDPHPMCWKHEKWTQESLLFWQWWVYNRDLCEGWNLVSVPGNLMDPSLEGAFGRYGTERGITAVYHYTGGDSGTWEFSFLDPVSGGWVGNITSIVPGIGYWVWVSPPEMKWIVPVLPPDPLSPPPSYLLLRGWNLVGFTDIEGDKNIDAEEYFASICFPDNPVVVWEIDMCEDPKERWDGAFWYLADIDHDNGNGGDIWEEDEKLNALKGYWVSVSYDVMLRVSGD